MVFVEDIIWCGVLLDVFLLLSLLLIFLDVCCGEIFVVCDENCWWRLLRLVEWCKLLLKLDVIFRLYIDGFDIICWKLNFEFNLFILLKLLNVDFVSVLNFFVWERLFKILMDGRNNWLLWKEFFGCKRVLLCVVLNLLFKDFVWKKGVGV